MRQVADNANKFCGDGTTTATLLASSIYVRGQRLLEHGYNPIFIKRGLELGLGYILEFLEEISLQVESKEDLYNASMVATNFEPHLSEILSSALKMKGLNGIIHMEPNLYDETSLVVTLILE